VEYGNMEEWKEFFNKKIKLIFDDGGNHPSKKEGVVIEINSTHMILKINNRSEAINLNRIIRIEEVVNENT